MGDRHLYKISSPREDMTFRPAKFWRTHDWSSSTTRAREGYIEDQVLFAGDFDEVSIHLFPRVRTVRVRGRDAEPSALAALGLAYRPGARAHIFAPLARAAEVTAFHPTVFRFARTGFVCVRNGEYVSRQPQQAISCKTFTMPDALVCWNIEAVFVDNLDTVIATLSGAGVYFDEQT